MWTQWGKGGGWEVRERSIALHRHAETDTVGTCFTTQGAQSAFCDDLGGVAWSCG